MKAVLPLLLLFYGGLVVAWAIPLLPRPETRKAPSRHASGQTTSIRLVRRLTPEERDGLLAATADRADVGNLPAEDPWTPFLDDLEDGDEIWEFIAEPRPGVCGGGGLAIVRDGRILRTLVTSTVCTYESIFGEPPD